MISIDVFLDTLPVMGIGMGGIFLVMTVIYLMIRILGVLFPETQENK